MNNSDLNNIIAEIITTAKQQPGVTAVAAGGGLHSGLSVTVRLGTVETVEFNRDKSIGITVYKDKCKGSVSITDLSRDAITTAIKAACRIADFTEPDKYSGLADKNRLATEFPDLLLSHPAAVSAEQAIEKALECERAALDFDARITNSDGASFTTNESYNVYGNSDGFLAGYPTTRYSASCVVIGQDQGNMQRDYDYTVSRELHGLETMQAVGIKAATKTIARLGARKIKTCNAPVLYTPKLATGLWSTLVGAISGSNIYRKSSFLLDCIEQQIFPDFVNIAEDPYILKGLGSAAFDDEGVATVRKNIIDTGVLTTYILGSYSARRLGLESTGNAGGVHNLVVKPGNRNFEQLLEHMGTGLVVTELLGQGTNLVTGDYSHGAAGLWVENGKVQYPVEEITIAGNLRDMFKQIIDIGNDVDRRSNILTGSVLLENMMIAGA